MNDERRVIVVGTGPAGAAAATFLARAGIDVLMLEAGNADAAPGLTARVRGITVAKRRKELPQRAGVTMTGDSNVDLFEELAPGGLSNHWSCAVPRGSEDDFADAERAGEIYTWPLRYEDLAPWYDQVEPLLHIAGTARDVPQLPASRVLRTQELHEVWGPVRDAAYRLGRSVVAMPFAYGASTTVTPSGTAFNAFVRLVRPLVRSRRVELRCGLRALRVEWSPRLRRAAAVLVRNLATGSDERLPCGAVVLAAGAVNSAQILLESTSQDFPEGLGNDHGVVGRYFHDHPLGKLMIDLARPIPVLPGSYITRPTLDRTPPLYAAAGMQWTGANAFAQSVRAGHPGRLSSIGFSVFGTMAPHQNDRVTLDPSRPRVDGASAIALDVRHPPESKQVLDKTRDEILHLFERAGWGPKLNLWLIEKFGNSVHYGGTCRMHRSPEYGVVDEFCRLHGVPNVVVAGSATFTTSPEKNPVLTSMALSARAGDHLARELRRTN